MQKNKRMLDQDPDSEPETLPNSKWRRLTKLPESDTILMAVGDEDKVSACRAFHTVLSLVATA
jgi:hypothetical protein